MNTGPDSVAPISAPATGPDPRTNYGVDMPPAPGATDNGDPHGTSGSVPDPGFTYDDGTRTQTTSAGTGPMSAPGPNNVPATQAGGADDNGYGVSNAELGKMADELDLAAQILEKADKGLAESDATARIHHMLTSGRMLRSTTSDWDDEITRLAKQCRSLAGKMRQTHTNYTAQEHRTAQDFQAILASLEGNE